MALEGKCYPIGLAAQRGCRLWSGPLHPVRVPLCPREEEMNERRDFTLAVLILVFLFFRFTPLGLAMRATAQNPVSSRLVGIRVGPQWHSASSSQPSRALFNQAGTWQLELKNSASWRVCRDPETSIVSFDDRTADCQAHTHPVRFGGIEGPENAL